MSEIKHIPARCGDHHFLVESPPPTELADIDGKRVRYAGTEQVGTGQGRAVYVPIPAVQAAMAAPQRPDSAPAQRQDSDSARPDDGQGTALSDIRGSLEEYIGFKIVKDLSTLTTTEPAMIVDENGVKIAVLLPFELFERIRAADAALRQQIKELDKEDWRFKL